MRVLQLVKYQGLGNDFLVALDGDAFDAVTRERVGAGRAAPHRSGRLSDVDPVADLAIFLCQRRTGIGADGLLIGRASLHGGDVRMELRNSDGTRAETSGNGLRCFALAAVEAGVVAGTEVAIETDAGVRRARVKSQTGRGSADVAVDMGQVQVMGTAPVSDALCPGSTERPWPAWFVDVGNPHLVVLAPPTARVPIGAIGPLLEKTRPGGQNVEIASVGPEHDELSLVVWERGAGVTLACGTGSVAVAAALHSAGISPALVRVHNPGGTAEVVLTGQDPLAPFAELSGPVHRVARIEVDEAVLAAPEAVVVAS